MKVIEVAKLLGITSDTVRFYTRIRMLNPGRSHQNGYREYSDRDVQRLRFILSARQLGFSVDDIREILRQADNQKSPCPTVRKLIEERLREIDAQLEQTLKLKKRMEQALGEWNKKPDKAPTGHMICHLIEELSLVPEIKTD